MAPSDPIELALDHYLNELDRQNEDYRAATVQALETAEGLIDELKAAGHADAERLAGEWTEAERKGDLELAEGLVMEARDLLEEVAQPVAVGAGS